MKARSLLLLAAGFVAGLAVARRLSEDDPEVVHGPVGERRPESPVMRVVTGQTQRLAGRATEVSLSAIRRARGAIRERLDEPADAAWN